MFQISKPTKQQVLRTLEVALVTFVVSFVTVWAAQPDPFSKAAVVAALTAAATALYQFVKSLLTAV